MTNSRTLKKALLSSVIALVLCFSMLVGTTFAWFTDSVTSSGNIIQSGTLEIAMTWADGSKDPNLNSTVWANAEDGAIFNNDKWEPGYVEAKHIKIENKGTLALKYRLLISPNGEVENLADVIDVYFVENATSVTRDALATLTPVGTLRDLINDVDGAGHGALLPVGATATDTYERVGSVTSTIAFKMREEAGNEYQGKKIGSDFAIVLMATQYNYEPDSIGKDYDDIEIPNVDIQVIGGNTYHYCDDGNLVLASVPYGNVGATFTVDEGVTIVGRGNTYGEGKPVFSKYSPIETITLNEGLKEIKARAMTGIKTLTKVNFPSTLEVIGVQSIAQSGMSELTIPATVKEIKYGAFTASPKLKTVTIEGNALLDNYVFRDCASLETIYLLGDDVQFVGGGMFATRKQSGDANGITIYVKNDTVAARLVAAQASAYGYEVKIIDPQGPAVVYVNDATELQTALDNVEEGNNVICFKKDIVGDVTVNQKKDFDITINGNGKSFKGVMLISGNGKDESRTEKLNINDITFIAATDADGCIVTPDRTDTNAYSYSHNVTVKGCTFTNPDGVSGCAAIRHKDGGDENWTIDSCIVEKELHSILQVNNVQGTSGLVINNCQVYSKNGANFNYCTNVKVSGCTFDVTGYALRFGVKNGGNVDEAKNFVVENSTLKSQCDSGDAVIMFRASAVNATLTLTNTTLVGTTEISGNTTATTITRN